MVVVAQLVRALDCGSRCRRFESGLPPNETNRFFNKINPQSMRVFYLHLIKLILNFEYC